MKRPRIHVTDHAVLRYCELVMGIDVQVVRAEVTKTVAVAEEHQSCTAVTSNGLRYVLANDALVTIRTIGSSASRVAAKKPKVRLP